MENPIMSRMKKIIAALILVTAVILVAASYYLSGLVISPRMWDYEETCRTEIEKGNIRKDSFERLPAEDMYLESPHGYKIHALYIPHNDSKKTVILSHGFTFTLMGSIKYIDIFLTRGFNILAYDHRHHGKSGGSNVTFGYYEKDDLKACVDWALARTGMDTRVGIHGESMGAAVALQYASTDSRASFIIADGSFSDLKELLAFQLAKDFGLPSFPLVPVASLVAGLRGGMFFGDVSPVRDIPKVVVPVMIIHGAADAYVPPAMARALYDAIGGKKRLYLGPCAGHSESFTKNPAEYDLQVGEFLREIGF
jgi:uncharacterized protein